MNERVSIFWQASRRVGGLSIFFALFLSACYGLTSFILLDQQSNPVIVKHPVTSPQVQDVAHKTTEDVPQSNTPEIQADQTKLQPQTRAIQQTNPQSPETTVVEPALPVHPPTPVTPSQPGIVQQVVNPVVLIVEQQRTAISQLLALL